MFHPSTFVNGPPLRGLLLCAIGSNLAFAASSVRPPQEDNGNSGHRALGVGEGLAEESDASSRPSILSGRLGVRYEFGQLDEMELQHTFPGFFFDVEVSTDVEEVDHRAVHLEYEWDAGPARMHASLFREELQLDGPVVNTGPSFRYRDDLEMRGLEVGGRGEFDVWEGESLDLFGVWGLSGSVQRGDGDGLIDDVSLFEVRTRLGAGVGSRELRIQSGGFARNAAGSFDLERGDVEGDELEIDLVAAFLGLTWQPERLPVRVQVEGFLGGFEGVAATLQFRF